VNILRDLRHQNIVKYYDRIIDKESQKIFIIMEYCEGGDLAQFLKRLKSTGQFLPEEVEGCQRILRFP
jgi:NIMA (never in mitosis gene a)-related kinase